MLGNGEFGLALVSEDEALGLGGVHGKVRRVRLVQATGVALEHASRRAAHLSAGAQTLEVSPGREVERLGDLSPHRSGLAQLVV